VKRRARRSGVSLGVLLFGVGAVWGGLVILYRLGAPPVAILLTALVVFEVAAVLWGVDSRRGRNWPRRREWGAWVGRSPGPPGSPATPRRPGTG
jgi:hypothetical protein